MAEQKQGCSPKGQPEVMNDREDGKRGLGISVLMARQDDDDDDNWNGGDIMNTTNSRKGKS